MFRRVRGGLAAVGLAAVLTGCGSVEGESVRTVVTVYLRRRGSPGSEPVGMAHAGTGDTG